MELARSRGRAPDMTTGRNTAPHDERRPQMNERLVPLEMTLVECAAVNWVLSRVKDKILTGTSSGVVIDQALEEVLEAATSPTPTP